MSKSPVSSVDHCHPYRRKMIREAVYCRVWARQRPVGSLQHHCVSVRVCVCVCECVCVCVVERRTIELTAWGKKYPFPWTGCVCVCSLHKCMSFKTAVWMEATRDVPFKASCAVLSGRGWPLPASWFRLSGARVYTLALRSVGLWSPSLCPPCAGSLFESFRLFAWARQSSVWGLALFMQLCAPYIMYMYMYILGYSACRLASSLPARFDSWSRWSILWFKTQSGQTILPEAQRGTPAKPIVKPTNVCSLPVSGPRSRQE